MAADTDTSDYPVEYHFENNAAWITLDRPHRLNAITEELFDGIEAGLSQALDDEARVVVLQGNGRAFCVGADLKNHREKERTLGERRDYLWRIQDACNALQTFELPIVAKVHGYAIGGGTEIALSTDIIVASDDVEIRLPETTLGTYVTGGVTYTLPQRVGIGKAKELILTGNAIDGTDAARIGLVDQLAPPEDLDARVTELVSDLAANAPIPMAMAKEHLNSLHADRSLWLSREVEGVLTCMGTDDWHEGVASFAEDRDPQFRGT